MNKKILLAVVILLFLAGGGFYFYKTTQNSSESLNLGKTDVVSSAFGSVKDALSKSISLSCEYTDPEGVLTKTYIKNGSVRVSLAGDSENPYGEVILKENKMYMWSDTKKEGFSYEFESTTTDTNLDDQTAQTGDRASIIEAIEAYKDYCKIENVSDSLFEVPSDVKFLTMNQMLEDLSGYQENLQEQGTEE